MSRHITAIGLSLLLLTLGCQGQVGTVTGDEAITGPRISELTFFVSANAGDRADIRIATVNHPTMLCLDGEEMPFCTLERFDFSNSELSKETAAAFVEAFQDHKGIIYGWMEMVLDPVTHKFVSTLYVIEAWHDPTPGELGSAVYEVYPSNIYCIKAPCPVFRADPLNTLKSDLVAGLDLAASQADKKIVDVAYDQVQQRSILVGGTLAPYPGDDVLSLLPPLPKDFVLVADTFYLRVHD